jgi:hypothetical protein
MSLSSVRLSVDATEFSHSFVGKWFKGYPHSTLHTELLARLAQYGSEFCTIALLSLTLQITPTRLRVPSHRYLRRNVRGRDLVSTLVPLVLVEVLSPEDTMMHVCALEF